MTEDKVDSLQNQLHETIRKLKDGIFTYLYKILFIYIFI